MTDPLTITLTALPIGFLFWAAWWADRIRRGSDD